MSTIGELNQIIGGLLCRADTLGYVADAPLGPVVSDSRKIGHGDVFWALRGPNHQGEEFAGDAFRKGAAGAVVGSDVVIPHDRWAIRVEDTQRALWDWAQWKRSRFNGTVIAVTGARARPRPGR